MIDIIAAIIELAGKWVVGNKNRFGFILHIICCVLWIYVSFSTKIYGLLIITVPAIGINIRNYSKWKKKCDTNMCEELSEQLERGQQAARDLIEHFENMGDPTRCSIPIETDNGCYIIEVRKTL